MEAFAKADIIFIDRHQNGSLESLLAKRFETLLKPGAVIIWDDILLSTMVDFWKGINIHKLDFRSLGHNSGTGVSRLISGS